MVMNIIHISCGDPTVYRISAGGKIYNFEWHRYCGPIAVRKDGSECVNQPEAFLHAASQWNAQGRKIDGDLCVWHEDPEMITKHIGGRHHVVVGYAEPVAGF